MCPEFFTTEITKYTEKPRENSVFSVYLVVNPRKTDDDRYSEQEKLYTA
jgi:hypothetical protein